ncbi:MAG TPA: response regulator [Pyrinomonadaceae bacterium]|nr:response regulator [Pyrinomonadaceae bacterium]
MSDSKCRILYVDDHEDTGEMLRLILADADYEVLSARSVDQALEMSLKYSFDLYVVDKRLPDGSGLELVKQLNQLTPRIPSIVYTGDVYEVHREQAMAAGAHAFVCKPDIETLINTVHDFLSRRECATATAA